MWTNRIALLVFCLVLAPVGVAVSAEAPEAPEAPEASFMTDFVADLERVGGKLHDLAAAIPAEQYDWAPTDEVRSVSEVFMHVAGANLLMPSGLGAAPAEGVEVPEGGPMALLRKLEAEVTAKDEVIAMLDESLAYAKSAVPQIEDLETEVDMFGFPASKRAYLLILLTHNHEHLGQAIAYARSLGVVPPWSRPLPPAEEAP